MNTRKIALTTIAIAGLTFTYFSGCKKSGSEGSSSSALSYVPKTSTGVISISFNKASSSSLFKKYKEKFLEEATKEITEFKSKCGIDPATDLHSILAAVGADFEKEEDYVFILKGKFDKIKAEKCVVTLGGSVEGTIYKTKRGKILNAYWPASDTVVLSPGITGEKLEANAKGGNVNENKELMALINKADSGAVLWGAGLVPLEYQEGAPMGAKMPNSTYFSVNVADAITAKIGVLYNSADDAKASSDTMDLGLKMLGSDPKQAELLKSITKKQDGSTLTIDIKITEEQITQLLSQFGGMF